MGVRVGVIGAGGISPGHGQGWRALGADLHVYSLEFGPRFVERHGAVEHASLDELLAAVDIVDIVTPTPSHAEIVRAALEAGKDVVCEKPMARTAAEAAELVVLAEKLGRRLYPAHVVRWFPQYAAAKAAVAAGELGDLAVMRFTRGSAMPKTPWFADDEASGGLVMDQMIHDLDQAAWIGGPVEQVYAREVRSSANDGADEVRVCHVTLNHANGAISHCRGLWAAPGIRFWYTFHIAGTTGMLRYDSRKDTGFSLTQATGAGGADVDYVPTTSSFPNPYGAEIADFAAAITGGAEPRVTMHDGLVAVQIAEAAVESLRTGGPVAVAAADLSSTNENGN